MMESERLFKADQPMRPSFTIGDGVIFVGICVFIYVGVRLAVDAPAVVQGPDISLSPRALPWYAALSVGRMAAAYALSLLFSLVYGYIAAYSKSAERVLLPLLDILQSVPILSFLPVVVLGLTALLPQGIALELASVILIFTSQAWNLTFSWYQSLTTIPNELREASSIFRLNRWLRLKTLELPFGMVSLIWNSMMSWAGGWFFLMAAEIFTVGQRDFRLPGLGSYLKEAADSGDTRSLLFGLATLLLVIISLDQFVWQPLLAWSARFRLGSVSGQDAPASWFYDAMHNARLVHWLRRRVLTPASARLDAMLFGRMPERGDWIDAPVKSKSRWMSRLAALVAGVGLTYGAWRAIEVMTTVAPSQWQDIGLGLAATLVRVVAALVLALAWTVPVGVAIGTNPRVAAWLQPVVQIAASVPATGLFPILLLAVAYLPGEVSTAAVILMLLGTQWYLLFNVIAGASAIPQDLKYTAQLLQLSRVERWRTLILPALMPYVVTGAITAAGGAWNASIVAEYVTFGGKTLSTIGIGAQIAQATAVGDYALLLAATAGMIATVVSINRFFWRRLYRLAEEQYRME
jgi:NitT/TauT family transport system permease protein